MSAPDMRDYQARAVAALEHGTDKVPYVLPTGGGKTIVASALTQRTVEAGKRVLVLTHRREIFNKRRSRRPLNTA